MAAEFSVAPATLREVAQALQQAKGNARAVDNIIDAMIPLSNEPTTAILINVCATAKSLENAINQVYHSIAREAMT